MTLHRQGGELEPLLQPACPSHDIRSQRILWDSLGFPLSIFDLWLHRADCMCCSTTISYKGLAHLQILEPIPGGYQGTTVKFVGSQKLCADFRLHGERGISTSEPPPIVQRSPVINGSRGRRICSDSGGT